MTIKERLAKMLTVKSLVTLILVCVFAYLSIVGVIAAAEFQTVFLMIITFYFTRRTDTNEAEMPVDKEIAE